ncbi:MAG: iron chelate uptake ABC transporter family permease subunit [Kangiellaceae bacterium]|jgi:heme transport system permease protein
MNTRVLRLTTTRLPVIDRRVVQTSMLSLVLLVAAWCSISIGAAKSDLLFPIKLIGEWIASGQNQSSIMMIVSEIRLPRVILAILIGAALAVSGASLQGVCRNPLADPGLLGISSGAAVGAVTVIIFANSLSVPQFIQPYLIPIAAFVGAAITTFTIYRLAQVNGTVQIATLLLAGVAINAMGGAIIGAFSYVADDQSLRLMTFWMMGSLASANWFMVAISAPVLILGMYFIHKKRTEINLLLLGEANARYVGVDVDRVKHHLLWLNAIVVGVAVACSGIIGFIGLVVPHILRVSTGADYRYLILNSGLLGGGLLVLADLLSRTLITPAELPIGVVTAILGAPFFILLLLQQKRKLVLAL